MENLFLYIEQPITANDLDNVEHTFHFTFPKEFRNHYLRYNGGSPSRCLFIINNTIFVIHQFLSIKYGKTQFEDSFRNLKIDENILPPHLIPFAVDPGGDYYCFSARGNDAGSIWVYRGEYFDEPDKTVEFLATSLNEFVEGAAADDQN